MLHIFRPIKVFCQRKAPCSQSVRLATPTRDNQSLVNGNRSKGRKKAPPDSAADLEGGSSVSATPSPPGGSGVWRILTHTNPLLTYACDLLHHYYCRITFMTKPVDYLLCLFASPPAFLFFPARNLERGRGGCALVEKKFWTTPSSPSAQIKRFYNRP